MKSLYIPLYLVILLSVLLVLCSALYLHLSGWSVLAVLTGAYIISWPLAALWYWLYHKIKKPIQQLLIYCQSSNEHISNLQPEFRKLPLEYQALITQINQKKSNLTQPDDALLLTQVAEQLPFPMLIFDKQNILLFANKVAAEALKIPLLSGCSGQQLGFTITPTFNHPVFSAGWQQHSINCLSSPQQYTIFYALDLRHPLYQQQKHSQQQLIRVLSHELRNSLTPMASMTETLLENTVLPPVETRQVLQRIQQRSHKLLKFIDNYAHLNHLPAASFQWFNIDLLLQDVKLLSHVTFEFSGESHCYGDPVLLSQLLFNLLKNAIESIDQKHIEPNIKLTFFHQNNMQVLEITDNGLGFSNLDNLFVPFYTTKPEGSGVGLQLCKEIMQQHHGELTACNSRSGGAKVTAHWPAS